MSTVFHCTKLRLSKYNSSWIVSIKKNVNFKLQPLAMFVFFVFRKNALVKSCSSSEGLSEYKIPWYYVEWCKFYIHLKSLYVRHFGMVAATALKLWHRGHLQWHDLPSEFYKIYQLLQNLIGWTGTHLISLLFSFRTENKLKMYLTFRGVGSEVTE
jgi:hypothetical protein